MTQVPPPRRLSHWAAANAWKLSVLTALTTFLGVLLAVSVSLILRPTRSYFFPLLSDVDAHHPECAILRLAVLASTALLCATTSACALHGHALRLFARDRGHAHAHVSTDLLVVEEIGGEEEEGLGAVTKRRLGRVRWMQTMMLVPILITMGVIVGQMGGIERVVETVMRKEWMLKMGGWFLCGIWFGMTSFLFWYFVKLQNVPDRVESDGVEEGVVGKVWEWAGWIAARLRPICLTGQVVCVIKIVGLWLALESFSISRIRLVRIALLAALAFAEYTAAFFFAFFLTILAVDMRRKWDDAVTCTG